MCVGQPRPRTAPPLGEALGPAATLLDGLGVQNMRVKFWKEVILNANWKMAQEAFFEGYHVLQTHPQLWQVGAEATIPALYEVYDKGHGRPCRWQRVRRHERRHLHRDDAPAVGRARR